MAGRSASPLQLSHLHAADDQVVLYLSVANPALPATVGEKRHLLFA
jgi:hypothetical protein